MTETWTSGLWIVKPGEADAFVAAWREFVTWAAEMDGHGSSRLLQDTDNPAHYLSFSPWDTVEAQENWRGHKEFSERLGRVRDHCSEFVPSIYKLAAQVD